MTERRRLLKLRLQATDAKIIELDDELMRLLGVREDLRLEIIDEEIGAADHAFETRFGHLLKGDEP
jgi:hypothetical protein